jgi:hypothetical protein
LVTIAPHALAAREALAASSRARQFPAGGALGSPNWLCGSQIGLIIRILFNLIQVAKDFHEPLL